MRAKLDLCKSCGSPILWAVTLKGKATPIDPEPRPDGNLVLEDVDGGPEVRHRTITQARKPDPLLDQQVPRYVSHFATCEFAEQHRRRG